MSVRGANFRSIQPVAQCVRCILIPFGSKDHFLLMIVIVIGATDFEDRK